MFRLVAQDLCPYVQRCRVLLEEKGAPYVTEYIQLDDKPRWFTDLAPSGRVPLLIHGDVVLDESITINEYIDAHWGVPVQPADGASRALAREHLKLTSDSMTALWRVSSATDEETRIGELRSLEASLERLPLMRALPPHDASLDLYECALVPLGLRLRWMAEISGFPVFRVPAALEDWFARALDRPSASASVLPHVREKFQGWLQQNLPC